VSYNFALIGAAGYVAPRHMRAIKDTGNLLVAATDPHDSVGVLDSQFLNVRYFPEIERFDRHLEKLRRGDNDQKVHYVSICSPNYLHDAHIRLALRVGAEAICEKPLVINPWNLDQLELISKETGRKINTILQLRVHPDLVELKKKLEMEPSDTKHDVVLSYVTGRGAWYHSSWKGNLERSGGLATNIGIHFFDLLMWLFGKVQKVEVHRREFDVISGLIELERANVRWLLSVDFNRLPFEAAPGKKTTYRSITCDGSEIEFTGGFTDLHTRVYEKIIAKEGFSIDDVRPSIELVHRIRTMELIRKPEYPHPGLQGELK
jgi:UDP-N-acetyl-2-amino-2-deoxyglucuronate dehydrogenase